MQYCGKKNYSELVLDSVLYSIEYVYSVCCQSGRGAFKVREVPWEAMERNIY